MMDIKFLGGKRISSSYNGFNIESDLPKSEGGDGTAPAPYELFLASIGNCAGLYVVYFCQNRNIPTDGIRMGMHFEIDKKSQLAKKVDIDIRLPDEFPEKYRKAVISAAEKCAVKQSLLNPPIIQVNEIE